MKGKATWQQAVELAYEQARGRLQAMDPIIVAEHSGSQWQGGYLEVVYLNKCYRIGLPEVVVKGPDGDPPLIRKVLILHYLTQAQGEALRGRWVDLRSLPGGVVYYPVFRGRVIARLVRMFGRRPEGLIKAAAPLGGTPIEMGDVAVKIPAFPRVPLVLVLWRGSEEFVPEGGVLYDESLPCYLSTEDAIVLLEEILGELKSYASEL